MADDPHNTSDISDTVDVEGAKEDAETTAARRELKQTFISEKGAQHTAQSSQDDKSASEDDTPADKGSVRTPSPEHGAPKLNHHDLREQVSSPKKKRAHDEVDESHEETKDSPKDEESSDPASTAAVTKSRSDRSEPEKKRPRDRQADEETRNSQDEDEPRSTDSSTRSSLDQPRPDAPASEAPETSKESKAEEPKKATSFANTTFGKLASSTTSPFGALGSSSGSKPSLFGGAGASSGFGGGSTTFNPAGSKSAFGDRSTAATATTTAASPFGTLNGSTGKSIFGSNATFGSAFGSSAFAAPRLSTFAKPGDALASDKPARPFGAPESDAEESDGEDNDQESGDEDGEKDENKEEDKDKKDADEKKLKLRKVEVDNGESNELTLLVVRAKMFQLEKEKGDEKKLGVWKERGAGMLKVNVPKSTVEIDDAGNADASSFDASVLDEDDESNMRQNARLIMRQDHTLRVILNTPILPAMSFNLDKKLKASFVLFTAFDGNEAKQVYLKLSDANATAFTNLMNLLKRRLSDV